jgi:hypothetical protein
VVSAVIAATAIASIAAIMPKLPSIVIDTVVVAVMADLMLTLLGVCQVIAARLRDSRHRDASGRRQYGQASCVAEMHVF